MTLDALWEALHLWIVDVYTQDIHKGVGGSSRSKGIPAKLWERALEEDFAPKLPPSRNDLLVLLSRNADRTIQRYGIEFDTIIYNDDALKTLRSTLSRKKGESETVQIKYHPGDLSRIWVMDPFTLQYLEIPAVDQEYTRGLSLWKHQVIKRYVHEELERDIDRTALILAKARLQKLVNSEFRGARNVRSRAIAARWLDLQVLNWMHDFSLPITHVPPPEHALSKDPSLSEPTSIAPLDHTTSEEVPTPTSVGVAEMSTSPPLLIAGVSLIGEDGTSQEACTPLPPMEESPQPPPPPANKRKRRSSKAVVTPPAETDSQEPPADLFAQFGIEASYSYPNH